jgi:DNA-binding LacI/PurR family transcriptional regulator
VIPGQPGISIGSDNYRGGYGVTEHLLQLGRRFVAFLGNASSHYPEFFERYRGCRDALAAAGAEVDPALQVDAITTEQAGYDAACELLARGRPFDAIVAASDLIAIGAMRAMHEHHIEVPRQVSVVGFDDIPAASVTNPPLTTVMQDNRRAGEVLVDTLLALIREEPALGQVMPTRLIVRRSCGAGVLAADTAISAAALPLSGPAAIAAPTSRPR